MISCQCLAGAGVFPCERSARQMWTWHALSDGASNSSHGTLRLTTGTDSGVENKPNYQMCFATGDGNRRFLRVWECPPEDVTGGKGTATAPDERELHKLIVKMESIKGSSYVRLVDVSKPSSKQMCISLAGESLATGALLELLPCQREEILQQWEIDTDNGEVTAAVNGLCVTAGWPYLSSIAFTTPYDARTVVVVMNEAPTDTYVDIVDSVRGTLRTAVTGHSIATILY